MSISLPEALKSKTFISEELYPNSNTNEKLIKKNSYETLNNDQNNKIQLGSLQHQQQYNNNNININKQNTINETAPLTQSIENNPSRNNNNIKDIPIPTNSNIPLFEHTLSSISETINGNKDLGNSGASIKIEQLFSNPKFKESITSIYNMMNGYTPNQINETLLKSINMATSMAFSTNLNYQNELGLNNLQQGLKLNIQSTHPNNRIDDDDLMSNQLGRISSIEMPNTIQTKNDTQFTLQTKIFDPSFKSSNSNSFVTLGSNIITGDDQKEEIIQTNHKVNNDMTSDQSLEYSQFSSQKSIDNNIILSTFDAILNGTRHVNYPSLDVENRNILNMKSSSNLKELSNIEKLKAIKQINEKHISNSNNLVKIIENYQGPVDKESDLVTYDTPLQSLNLKNINELNEITKSNQNEIRNQGEPNSNKKDDGVGKQFNNENYNPKSETASTIKSQNEFENLSKGQSSPASIFLQQQKGVKNGSALGNKFNSNELINKAKLPIENHKEHPSLYNFQNYDSSSNKNEQNSNDLPDSKKTNENNNENLKKTVPDQQEFSNNQDFFKILGKTLDSPKTFTNTVPKETPSFKKEISQESPQKKILQEEANYNNVIPKKKLLDSPKSLKYGSSGTLKNSQTNNMYTSQSNGSLLTPKDNKTNNIDSSGNSTYQKHFFTKNYVSPQEFHKLRRLSGNSKKSEESSLSNQIEPQQVNPNAEFTKLQDEKTSEKSKMQQSASDKKHSNSGVPEKTKKSVLNERSSPKNDLNSKNCERSPDKQSNKAIMQKELEANAANEQTKNAQYVVITNKETTHTSKSGSAKKELKNIEEIPEVICKISPQQSPKEDSQTTINFARTRSILDSKSCSQRLSNDYGFNMRGKKVEIIGVPNQDKDLQTKSQPNSPKNLDEDGNDHIISIYSKKSIKIDSISTPCTSRQLSDDSLFIGSTNMPKENQFSLVNTHNNPSYFNSSNQPVIDNNIRLSKLNEIQAAEIFEKRKFDIMNDIRKISKNKIKNPNDKLPKGIQISSPPAKKFFSEKRENQRQKKNFAREVHSAEKLKKQKSFPQENKHEQNIPYTFRADPIKSPTNITNLKNSRGKSAEAYHRTINENKFEKLKSTNNEKGINLIAKLYEYPNDNAINNVDEKEENGDENGFESPELNLFMKNINDDQIGGKFAKTIQNKKKKILMQIQKIDKQLAEDIKSETQKNYTLSICNTFSDEQIISKNNEFDNKDVTKIKYISQSSIEMVTEEKTPKSIKPEDIFKLTKKTQQQTSTSISIPNNQVETTNQSLEFSMKKNKVSNTNKFSSEEFSRLLYGGKDSSNGACNTQSNKNINTPLIANNNDKINSENRTIDKLYCQDGRLITENTDNSSTPKYIGKTLNMNENEKKYKLNTTIKKSDTKKSNEILILDSIKEDQKTSRTNSKQKTNVVLSINDKVNLNEDYNKVDIKENKELQNNCKIENINGTPYKQINTPNTTQLKLYKRIDDIKFNPNNNNMHKDTQEYHYNIKSDGNSSKKNINRDNSTQKKNWKQERLDEIPSDSTYFDKKRHLSSNYHQINNEKKQEYKYQNSSKMTDRTKRDLYGSQTPSNNNDKTEPITSTTRERRNIHNEIEKSLDKACKTLKFTSNINDFYNKNQQWQQKKFKWREERSKENQERELKSCTFNPRTSSQSPQKKFKSIEFYQKNVQWSEQLKNENASKHENALKTLQKSHVKNKSLPGFSNNTNIAKTPAQKYSKGELKSIEYGPYNGNVYSSSKSKYQDDIEKTMDLFHNLSLFINAKNNQNSEKKIASIATNLQEFTENTLKKDSGTKELEKERNYSLKINKNNFNFSFPTKVESNPQTSRNSTNSKKNFQFFKKNLDNENKYNDLFGLAIADISDFKNRTPGRPNNDADKLDIQILLSASDRATKKFQEQFGL